MPGAGSGLGPGSNAEEGHPAALWFIVRGAVGPGRADPPSRVRASLAGQTPRRVTSSVSRPREPAPEHRRGAVSGRRGRRQYVVTPTPWRRVSRLSEPLPSPNGWVVRR